MNIHITAAGLCASYTAFCGVWFLANGYLESLKPYLSAWTRRKAVALNLCAGALFIAVAWMAR